MVSMGLGKASGSGLGRKGLLAVFGPGLVVMLADTDVGSVITAAQSGVQWGYRLLALQFVLVPILYVVQELTVRLGIFTGKGHGELIRETFGPFWAWISVAGLGIAAVGALLTEFSGVTGIGELFGLPRAWSLAAVTAFLLLVVWTGSYRRVERVAIILGLFEFAFFGVAIGAHPSMAEIGEGLVRVPIADKNYLYLVAANIGAVIMPWMVFYQQSAVADKRLGPQHYSAARIDTAIGAFVTQLVMAAVLVATAATLGKGQTPPTLNAVSDIAQALTPVLGSGLGRLVFSAGTLGAALVAAIVVSLAAAWGFGEVTGYKHSLEHRPLEAPWFYAVYSIAVIGGALLVLVVPDLVELNIAVEVMNALLLPVVLGFLLALGVKALPPAYRLRGWYLAVAATLVSITAALGVYGGLSSIVAS
jgi:NRAMP (natural resistance-associated macrophage protein)-like metal ion transporter